MSYATLQQVRQGYEEPVEEALQPFGVPLYTANQYTDDVANLDEFCYVDLAFRDAIELTLTKQVEYLRGSLTIDLFTRKGEGPGRSQTVLEAVMRALNALEQGNHTSGAGWSAAFMPGPRLCPSTSAWSPTRGMGSSSTPGIVCVSAWDVELDFAQDL
jgi:hypothetical protein